MATYRLSALTIFIILLAVLLIGFLMHNTWEYFTCGISHKEGFHTDYTTSSLAQSLDGYSGNNKKVVKLATDLYFDPVSKLLIEKHENTLYMKKRDGTELTHSLGTTEYDIVPIEKGFMNYEGKAESNIELLWQKGESDEGITVEQAKTKIKDAATEDTIYAMMLTNPAPQSTIDDTAVRVVEIYTHKHGTIKVSNDGANYPTLNTPTGDGTNEKGTAWRFKILSKAVAYRIPEGVEKADPKNIAWKTHSNLGVLHVPLVIAGESGVAVTFIHVMDIENNSHIESFYFNGNQVETYAHNDKIVKTIASGKTIYDYTNGTKSEFEGAIQDVKPTLYSSAEDLKVNVSHDEEAKVIYFAGRVDNNIVRTFVKITESSIEMTKIETSYGISTDSESDKNSGTSTVTETTATDIGGISSESELGTTLQLIKSIKDIFGNSNSDYFLKTEVVPPVCPTCPSCPHENGVCTNCGGNGGSGTQGSSTTGDNVTSLARDAGTGATNLARDGATGATNLARDAASETVNIATNATTGTVDIAKDAASGTANLASNAASGTANLARDTASGTANLARDTASGASNLVQKGVSGAYGAATDITQGAIGLGREVAGGIGNVFGPSSNSGGYQNSYGGPQYHNQGGYMNPRQGATPGQDPYSYYGAVPPRYGGCNYMPRTADFSSFGR